MAESFALPKNDSLDKALTKSFEDYTSASDTYAKEATEHKQKAIEYAGEIDKEKQDFDKLTPPSIEPPKPAPQAKDYESSPYEVFGSAASMAAIFGSLFTRKPMTNALNALAGVMTARHSGDRQAYEDAKTSWQENFDASKTYHEWQKNLYDEAVGHIETDSKLAAAKFEAYGAAMGDDQVVMLAKQGNFQAVVSLLNFRDQQYYKALQAKDLLFREHEATQLHEERIKEFNIQQEGQRQQRADLAQYRADQLAFQGRKEQDTQDWRTMQFGEKKREFNERSALQKAAQDLAKEKSDALEQLRRDMLTLSREKFDEEKRKFDETFAQKDRQWEDRKQSFDKGQFWIDPETKDAAGNPTSFVYHPYSSTYKTLDGKDFTPSAAARPASGAAGGLKPLTLAQLQAQAAQQKMDELKTTLGREPTADEKISAIQEIRTGKVPESEEDRMTSAALAATGMPFNQIIYGYGTAAQAARTQLKNDTVTLLQTQSPGMSREDAAQELANRTIDFQAGKRSVSQLTTVLGTLRPALDQLDYNIKQTIEAMKAVGSSDLSPIVNAIRNKALTWTGDPNLAPLFYYMNGVATESARIQSGGTASIAQLHTGAAEEAKKWANEDMTPAAFAKLGEAMRGEAKNRIENYETAIKRQRIGGGKEAETPGKMPLITTQEEFDKLEAGTHYTESDGKEYVK
jgi:hypothetical protein